MTGTANASLNKSIVGLSQLLLILGQSIFPLAGKIVIRVARVGHGEPDLSFCGLVGQVLCNSCSGVQIRRQRGGAVLGAALGCLQRTQREPPIQGLSCHFSPQDVLNKGNGLDSRARAVSHHRPVNLVVICSRRCARCRPLPLPCLIFCRPMTHQLEEGVLAFVKI